MSEGRDFERADPRAAAVERALRDLRFAVGRVVTPPPPAAIRARARRGSFRPRLVTGLVTAAAVVAVVAGATAAVRNFSTASSDPAGGRHPSGSATSPAPRPSRSIPPRPQTPVNDPIARIDWKHAAIIVPAHPDPQAKCPSGRIKLTDGQSASFPKLVMTPQVEGFNPIYGDLTGDGQAEAVIHMSCALDAEDSLDGAGQLMVVTREADGTLRALAWVGPRGGQYAGWWIAGGVLFADISPWHTDFGYSLGAAQAYRWRNGTFEPVDSGLPGLQPIAGRPGPEIDLRPVTDWLGCPGGTMRIEPGGAPDEASTARHDGYLYNFAANGQPVVRLVDLAGDGHRYLLVGLACRPADATPQAQPTGLGLLVLDRTATGYAAIDFVPVPVGYTLEYWSIERGTTSIVLGGGSTGNPPDLGVWYWNGFYFQR
jgi:hypothetical protein